MQIKTAKLESRNGIVRILRTFWNERGAAKEIKNSNEQI